jgi:ELWxxDGT repeat protein
MLKDLRTGKTATGVANSSSPINIYGGRSQFRQFAVLGNEVYFRASTVTTAALATPSASELWKSDGTAKGTVMVMKINPRGSSTPQYITAVGSRHIFFQASDGNAGEGMGSGSELWMTDGTTAGTKRVTEINPADNSAAPLYMTLSGGKLFFRATDGRKGYELWMVDPGATGQSIGQGCPVPGTPSLTSTDPVLGGNVTLSASGKPGIGLALLLGVRQNPLSTSVGFGCHVYVDITTPHILQFYTPAANGSWKLNLAVPNNAALKGVEVMAQVGYGPTGTLPFGIDLSPAMKLTLGN